MGFSSVLDQGFLLSTQLVLNSFSVLGRLRLLIASFVSLLHLVHVVDFGEQERCPAKAAVLQMIKTTVPVVEFGCLLDRVQAAGREKEEEAVCCAVCLCCMESGEKVRELWNCSHVFHKGCLDKWVESQAHPIITCPLCRSTLLPHWAGRLHQLEHSDSWMVDRRSYLLGEDLWS